MKTKNNSFKKAALPVVGVLAAAIVSLTSVTYAWFTYGNEATVDQIDVNVETAGGLQIAVGNGNQNFNWVSNVTPPIDQNIMLTPVSSTGAVTNGVVDFYKATYDDTLDKIYSISKASNPVVVGDEENDDPYSYISFDLYFRNAEAFDKVVDLSGTTVTAASGNSNLAVRMAFVKQDSISSTAANQTVSAFDETYSGNVAIYEPNATLHTTAGEEDYFAYKGESTGEFAYRALAKEDANAANYYNRYTGDKYQLTTVDGRAPGGNYSQYFVLGTTATAGEKFTQWNIDNDFNAIGIQEAADLRLQNGTTIYTKNESSYSAVDAGADLVNGTDYYIYNPVNLYTKTAYNTDAEAGTVNDTLSEIIDTQDDSYDYIELTAQTVTKVTVFIWIEGQDADCTNAVAGYQFSVNLKFVAGAKPTTPAN